ncbi:carbohydrate ABC transporter permease [Pseudogemmobacter sonorensis]|uniref:carbohydrate ABC transporter permease n=1 Tax=Pseudogemmobacter sonorensis TaxID=2989681 RepID=UPI003682F236
MKPSRTLVHGLLLLSPTLVLLVGFTLFPTMATLWDSFHSTPRGRRAAVWVGMQNYQTMLNDPVFWKAMRNTAVYAAVTIPASIGLALGLALLVNANIRGRAFARLAFFTPTILPMVAVANIWMFFYAPDYGLIDQVLKPLGLGGNNWLGSPATALGALIVITVWKNAGFFMIFYLAALQQISPTLIEAATLEGARPWQRLRRVILPLVMPTTLFVAINAVIEAFRLIDHVMTMTRGGPDNSTQLLLYYIWQTGFGFWDTAYASALTVVLLVILALIALVQFGWLDRKVFYR